MHSINATIIRKEDVPEGYHRLFKSTAHPDFAIASTGLLIQHGWDNTTCKHADISTDYFGGSGSQYASFHEPERPLRHFPDLTKGGAINAALSLLGVPQQEGKDLFDVLGLSRFRQYEDLTPIEPQ